MKRLLFFIVVFTVLGCTKVDTVMFNGVERAPKTDNVDVYSNADNITKPYKEIGIITLDDEGWGQSDAKLVKRAIKEAKKVGADGIILNRSEKVDAGGYFIGTVWIESKHNVINITLIEYVKE